MHKIYSHNSIPKMCLLTLITQLNVADDDGWTPLHAAVSWGHVDCVRSLALAGADLTKTVRIDACAVHLRPRCDYMIVS